MLVPNFNMAESSKTAAARPPRPPVGWTYGLNSTPGAPKTDNQNTKPEDWSKLSAPALRGKAAKLKRELRRRKCRAKSLQSQYRFLQRRSDASVQAGHRLALYRTELAASKAALDECDSALTFLGWYLGYIKGNEEADNQLSIKK